MVGETLAQVVIGGDAAWTYLGIVLIGMGVASLAGTIVPAFGLLSTLIFAVAATLLFGLWPMLAIPAVMLVVVIIGGCSSALLIGGGAIMLRRGLAGSTEPPTPVANNDTTFEPRRPGRLARDPGQDSDGEAAKRVLRCVENGEELEICKAREQVRERKEREAQAARDAEAAAEAEASAPERAAEEDAAHKEELKQRCLSQGLTPEQCADLVK